MIAIDGNSLSVFDVFDAAVNFRNVTLKAEAIPAINKSRAFVEKLIETGKPVYGITTGFGEFANKYIPPEETDKLQLNLIRSHSVGVGDPLPEDVVRGMILLRANALAKGFSGVRLVLIETLLELLNKRIYPYIPCQGSVGASGDLAPLSHLALTLIGEGECIVNGRRLPSDEVFSSNNIKVLEFKAKEGLGLTNGTQLMASLASLSICRAKNLLKNVQIAAAMSIEALKGTTKAFDEKIHMLRPHPGQMIIAENMRNLLADSEIVKSHINCEKVQDAYTIRCIPQIIGPVIDTLNHVEKVLTIEINSATDNPLIFPDTDEAISGGNFHGECLAFAMDFLGIALSETANISERLIDRLVNPYKSGLPAFLTRDGGLNSGFMITQYTAAALVSENKVLAHPASVDSVPTSAGQEDHVSMGTIACRHCADIIKNLENILSIHMLTAAQGIEFWDMTPGTGTAAALKEIRRHISFMNQDRVIYKDMSIAKELVVSGAIVKAVEEVVKLK